LLGAIAGTAALARGQKSPGNLPYIDPKSVAPFVDPLPLAPIAKSVGNRNVPGAGASIPLYRISMRPITVKVHRDLRPTRMWGFEGYSPGPTFEVRKDQPISVEWACELPREHLLAVDHTLHGAERDKPDVRAVIHLHGAKVSPESDGYPEAWIEPGKSTTAFYPNGQNAAMLWYHDHAMGITRLNNYAGLFGLYFIRDKEEERLGLPHGKYELPLVICDRMIDTLGQLYYPVSGNPESPWRGDVYGNLALVNSKLLPYVDVDPRPYRLRMLNASNARFYGLSLSNRQPLEVIGSDQGLLNAPAAQDVLWIAPGERWDTIVDFSGQGGENVVLLDDDLPILQFRVAGKAPARGDWRMPKFLRTIERLKTTEAVTTRNLTMAEFNDRRGRPTRMLLNDMHWDMPVTEKPALGSVEIWNLINLTDDSHPIHLHMVRFQLLERRAIDSLVYRSSHEFMYRGPSVPPTPAESGWKDTIRAEPKLVTRIIVRFDGYPGRYVWHCHVLEHEDNEMMRPYEVVVGI
jgi:spore coat protein A